MTEHEVAALPEGEKPTILLADDSRLIRVAARRILGEKFELILCEDGAEAWEQICRNDGIQAIFTDLGMPKMDGYALIDRIRQSENESIRNQPIIVITGAAEEDSVKRRVFEAGATDFVSKPFKSTEITARAEAHVSYRRDKQKLAESVDADLLTGALNKKGFTDALARDTAFVNRRGEALALVFFELDDFASIQKRVGQQTADRIIKQVATVLQRSIRKEDSMGRLGLARFAMSLPMVKTEGVVTLTRRLCAHVKASKLKVGGEVLTLSMSAGIAFGRKRVNGEGLLRGAAQALANARALGSGQVQMLKLENAQAEKPSPPLSIDSLLEALTQGRKEQVADQLDNAVKRLRPLIALLSEDQKRGLL